VNIPVRLNSAVRPKDKISFRLLRKEDKSPIKYDRIAQKDNESVPWKDIVKGYEYTKGKFVVLEDEDFKAAAIDSAKTIEILDFVANDDVDTRYFETPYYLTPQKGGEKAYALLREAIKQTGKIGIGKITMRTNSLHLAGVKAVEDALILEIMRFGDELVDASEFDFPSHSSVRSQELQMATQLIENLSSEFDPSKYTDDYHDNLMKIIKAKMKGKKIDVAEPDEPEGTKVVDLIARLQESLEVGKRSAAGSHVKPAKPAKRAKTAKRATRRKSA
jgi:DNA end-binding protein Ku